MSQLASVIEKAADAFAREIIAAVKASTLQELLAMQGVAAPAATGAKRRGRPPKVKPGRKPGRPPKTIAKKATAKKLTKKAAKKIKWPKCKHKGCTKNAWAWGKGYCGEHAKAANAVKKM